MIREPGEEQTTQTKAMQGMDGFMYYQAVIG